MPNLFRSGAGSDWDGAGEEIYGKKETSVDASEGALSRGTTSRGGLSPFRSPSTGLFYVTFASKACFMMMLILARYAAGPDGVSARPPKRQTKEKNLTPFPSCVW